MAYLEPGQKAFFKEHGYLVHRDLLAPEQIRAAQDALCGRASWPTAASCRPGSAPDRGPPFPPATR